jgi:hypothetical protein
VAGGARWNGAVGGEPCKPFAFVFPDLALGHAQEFACGDGVGERRAQRLTDRSMFGLDAPDEIG